MHVSRLTHITLGTDQNTSSRLVIASVSAAAIAFGVYVLTLAPDITWAYGGYDGGELVTASVTMGIPHPPGYPTYVILGKLFSYLPIGTIAYRYNFFSAVCGALAVGLMVPTIVRLHGAATVSAYAALATALTFAFLPLVWSQAIITEVYALNLLVVSAFLFVLFSRGAGFGAGVLFGLALTTHLTSVFLLIAVVLLPTRRNFLQFFSGAVLGLMPVLALPIMAGHDSPVVWGDPRTPAGWWWLVSGRLYQANVQMPNFEHVSILLRALIMGPALFIAGGGSGLDKSRSIAPNLAVMRRTYLTLAGLAGLYFVFVLLYRTSDAPVLLLPGLLVLALAIAPLIKPFGLAALLIPATMIVLLYSRMDLSRDYAIRPLAENALQQAPKGAILLTPGDRTIFTLWYYHHVENQRPDLILVDGNLFAFDWYRARLGSLYPEIWLPLEDDLTAFVIGNNQARSICTVGFVANDAPAFLMESSPNSASINSISPHLSCMEVNP